MTALSDAAVARLRSTAAWPEFDSPRYTVVEEIGRGGMGTVYRAFDDLLDREVALKVPNGFGEASVARRLQVEAGVLARLEHPGIVPIHDAGSLADGRIFYVMKLVRGRTLRDYLAGDPPIDDRLGVFERICEPVAFAHARGFVHRDLKPDNVMLGPFGEVLIMDWGAAASLASAPGQNGSPDATAVPTVPTVASVASVVSVVRTSSGIIGTRGFMAPEQAEGSSADARADVYALGAMLFLMLTGELPGAGLPSNAVLPAALRSICDRATAGNAADRYPDVTSLATDVRRYRAGLAVAAHRETLVERTLRFARTHRTALLLIAAYLVMRTIVAIVTGR